MRQFVSILFVVCAAIDFHPAMAGDKQNRRRETKNGRFQVVLNRKVAKSESPRVEVAGLTKTQLVALKRAALSQEKWNRILRISVASEKAERDVEQPAMLGTHAVAGSRIVFRPRFPFLPGLKYRAVFDPRKLPGTASAGKPVALEFSLPKPPPSPPSTVTRVFPSRKVLPENLLKFYIHFSAPMSRGGAYRYLSILDAKGKKIPRPFLELGEELWDRSGTRFTLFIDPGRIKRGLKPREDLGPVLESGKSYTLVIDRGWKDASGQLLKASFRKSIRVVKPDVKQPSPKRWRLIPAAAGTRKPLVVLFDEPLDRAMLGRVLTVRNAAGREVSGEIRVDRQETRWSFLPETVWKAGRFSLIVETALEDLTGNSIARPFEVVINRRIQPPQKPKTVALPFRITAKK